MLTGFEFMLSAQTISHVSLTLLSSWGQLHSTIRMKNYFISTRCQNQISITNACNCIYNAYLHSDSWSVSVFGNLCPFAICFTATLPPHSDFVSSCVYFHLNVLILFSHIHLSTFSRQLHVFLQILHIVATLLK